MQLHSQTAPSLTIARFSPQNPVFALYRSKASDVLATRRMLFAELRASSPRSAKIVERFCDTKLNEDSNPHLGEMLPWLIADIGMVVDKRLSEVAVGWLAVYLYGLLIDERADEGEHLTSGEQLASLLLLHTGLSHLHRAMTGTEFEAIFARHLAIAIEGQLSDVSDNSLSAAKGRQAYTVAKNSCLVCGATAVAAIAPGNGMALISMIEGLRLALQHLDDLGDWRDDARTSNHTIVLTDALAFARQNGNQNLALSSCSEPAVLRALVESGAIVGVLDVVARSLDEHVQEAFNSGAASPTEIFFRDLRDHVATAVFVADSARRALSTAHPDEHAEILDRVDCHLRIVAQGT
jgi:hypothetical protein